MNNKSKKMAIRITTYLCILSIAGCASSPEQIKAAKDKYEEQLVLDNQKTYQLPGDQIIDMLGKGLPGLLAATSSKKPNIKVIKDEGKGADSRQSVVLSITNYKPKDTSVVECHVPEGEGWAYKDSALEYGAIGIQLTPIDANTTMMKVATGFSKTEIRDVAGDIIGTVSTPYGGGVVRNSKRETATKSVCYSKGMIEKSIFDLIKAPAAQNAGVAPQEALVLDNGYSIGEHDSDASSFMSYAQILQKSNKPGQKIDLKNRHLKDSQFFSPRKANFAGVMYATGSILPKDELPKDEAAAFKLFEKAASSRNSSESDGILSANYNLAMMYERGIAVKKDEAKALKIYQEIEKYSSAAKGRLGYFYANGQMGLAKDEKKAAKIFTEVVSKKLGTGTELGTLRNLAYLYANGMGVKKNEQTAYMCYDYIAKRGDAKAQSMADYLKTKLTAPQIKEALHHQSHDMSAYLQDAVYQ